ncbi:MAG: sugar phosphate isomerase/epimerase [Oscillospiraceae bacterium]|nr:sugar phosphate isomerase/epimerase [Oscillospiraceae bacterium]
MGRKYSVITGFMGKVKDRFIDYQPVREMEEMVEMASRIKGCSGLEVVYPQNFTDPVKVKGLLDQYGLSVSTVNLNIKSDDIFRYGSFSSPDAKSRKEAVEMLKISMDAAAVLGCNMVTTAPLSDGSDYPFELDYIRAFEDAADAIREGAGHRADVKVSLEYKLSEPRVHCLLSNAGKAAVFCEKVGLPNVGVTLDIGHALQCGEVPADSLAFLYSVGRLFYIHINDNYRNWDWDLLPATVNFWDFIEFATYMKRVGYDGWITADVFPQRHDPIKIMEKTFEWMDVVFDLADKLDEGKLRELRDQNASLEILDYVRGATLGK